MTYTEIYLRKIHLTITVLSLTSAVLLLCFLRRTHTLSTSYLNKLNGFWDTFKISASEGMNTTGATDGFTAVF